MKQKSNRKREQGILQNGVRDRRIQTNHFQATQSSAYSVG